MPTPDDPLLVDLSAGVLRLTLNRPTARNAINHDLRARLLAALSVDAAAADVRVVVIHGGERAFCAGGDIKEMGGGPASSLAKLAQGAEIVRRIAELPKPVVAAVQGAAVGAGFSIALACDMIVADPTAVFSSIFIKRALIPDMAGTYWLARQVGLHRAKEIVFTGRQVWAREAAELGIVARLWETDAFRGELDGFLHQLADGPTRAYGSAKRLLNRTFETDLYAQMDAEALSQAYASGTQDHLDSVEAFRAKRPAVFRGE